MFWCSVLEAHDDINLVLIPLVTIQGSVGYIYDIAQKTNQIIIGSSHNNLYIIVYLVNAYVRLRHTSETKAHQHNTYLHNLIHII